MNRNHAGSGLAGAAAVATAQRVGGGGRGMGDLLAAVHPLGPGGLLLLGRAGGAVRTFACGGLAGTGSAGAGIGAVPASPEGIGHLLPGSGSAGRSAAACGLRAGLGDIAEASHRALGPAARSSGTSLECGLGAAGRRRGGACATAGQLGGGRGHACARHDGTAHAGRGGTDGNTCAGRAELRRTGHETRGDARPEDAQRQQRKRGQHHDQGMVDGRFIRHGLELGEQSRADADDDGQHQYLDARRHHVAEHLFREEAGLVPERERHQHEAGERGQRTRST